MEHLELPFPELTYKNQEWLRAQYINCQRSALEIGHRLGRHAATISYWLDKHGIPKRSQSEATHLARAQHTNLTHRAIEFIDGELLGDGNLNSKSPWSACFRHSSKYYSYAIWMKRQLETFGLESNPIYEGKCGKGFTYFQVSTLHYVELRPHYLRWYNDSGKKRIPKDLVLTPLTVRQWYIGDGQLVCPKRGHQSIVLSTQDFPREDVEYLVDLLNDLGFIATYRPSGHNIHISSYSTKKFLDFIGPCPSEAKIYGYKFDYKGEPPPLPTSQYKGVHWDASVKKWRASIRVHDTIKHLGHFEDEKDAALAFDEAVLKYRSNAKSLNFPHRVGGKALCHD